MNALTCPAARRRLQAYYDNELPVADQIAVTAHLEWCDACAAALQDLEVVGEALREALPGRAAIVGLGGAWGEDATVLPAMVVGRLKAEHDVSWRAHLERTFEDGHLVYAGAAAAVAALVCIVVTIAMMRFVNSTPHPNSLAALVDLLTPGSNQNPVVPRANVQMPKPLDAAFSTNSEVSGDDEAVFTLAGVVTREGRVEHLTLLPDSDHLVLPGTDEAKVAANLLDAVSRARFEPASVEGLPVAVNMVWLVAHTTVRGRVAVPDPSAGKPVGKRPVAELVEPRTVSLGA
jgi:Putative zinc-finger